MKQEPVIYLWALVLSFCIAIHTNASTLTQCNSADLVINRITINNINGNSVSFSYRIKNVGISTLYLNRMRFQLYLSQDNTLDDDDIAVGGAFFGNSAPELDYNEVYNGSFTCNSSVSLKDYPYLIMTAKVRTGYSMPECFTTNVFAKYLANNFADLQVDSLIRNVGFPVANTITYFISNKGKSTLDLSKMQYRVYYSIDNVYDMNDPIVASNTFSSAPLQIAPGGYRVDEISVNPPASSQYRYMIFMVVTLWGEVQHETNYNNNRLITPTRGGSATRTDAFHLEQKNDELTLVNNYEAAAQTHYVIYSVNGQLMREGVFTLKESLNVSDFTSGVYVVKVTDGISSESYKFAVTE